MNLQENIQRIKQMMGLLVEEDTVSISDMVKKDQEMRQQENIRRILSEEVNVKNYILRRYSFEELESILQDKLDIQSRNFKHYENKTFDFFMGSVLNSILNKILEELTDGWVEDPLINEGDLYELLKRIFEDNIKERFRNIQKVNSQENTQRVREMMGIYEGLHDTSWENDEGDKITLMDLLNVTQDIPVENISIEELKPHLLTWDGDEDEVRKIESADLQYPILIFVNDDHEFISIIDGHHRAQKAVRKGLETIKAKVIPINSLPKNIRRVFSHMN